MSFSLSNISGSQIQKDSFINNLTVACDPGLLAPKTDPLTGLPNPLNLEKRDGKTAIGVDICDLDVSNLTVNGNLVVKGSAEVCDIVCPENFTVTAGNNIIETAGGAVSLVASTGQISLDALGTANLFGTAGVKVQANNARSATATGNQSGGSLNVFPQVAGAKGLHVVCNDTVSGEFGIAADLTGTVILRSDDGGPGIGATGHLCFAPSSASGFTNIDPTINVGGVVGGAVQAATMLSNSADACGRFELTLIAGAADTATLRFAKPYPTPVTNVFISPANAVADAAIRVDGYFVQGTDTDFTLTFPNGITNAGDAQFDYFVVDVVNEGQQHG